MKFFTNKKIWSKIIIVLVFVILFEFIVTTPTLAENDELEFGGKLLSPILSLVVTLGDGVIGIVHNAIMGVNNSLIEVNLGSTIWEIIGRAFVWILAAAIAVAIVATGIGGILAATAVGLAVGVYGQSIVDNATADKISSAVTSFSELTIPDNIYLPAYTISPEEIFQGKILLFDINFFEEGEKPIAKETDRYVMEDGKVKTDSNGDPIVETDSEGNPIKDIEYYYYEDDENGEDLDLDGDGKPDIKGVKTSKQNMAVELRDNVSTWYTALRNIALVVMLSMLVYVGIRILLSSVASDKAKYKQMLQDWLVGMVLLFFMHYIMAFSIVIVENITKIVNTSIDKSNYSVIIPMSTDDGKKKKMKEFIESADMLKYCVDNSFNDGLNNVDDVAALVYPTNLIGYIRLQIEFEQFGTEFIGKSLCFLILVLMTVYFVFTYLKRVLYMAFLTIIAPLIAITYPIDKMNDGSAQGFNKWFKEYIFNLLIQPLHLLLYYILVTSAWSLSSSNILYSIVALGFMIPAEKLLRSLFGFEKAHTPGMLAGPGGAALTMAAVNKLSNLGKGNSEKGSGRGRKNSNSEEESDTRTPRMNGNVDANAMFDDNSRTDTTLPDGNTDGGAPDNPRFDAYDAPYEANNEDAGVINNDLDREEVETYLNNRDRQGDTRDLNEEKEEFMNSGNNTMNSNGSNSSSSSSSQTNTTSYQKPKRKIGRRIRRSLGIHGTAKYRVASGAAKLTGRALNKGIRFAGKTTAAVGLGAIGLAAGVVAGDPSQAFQNALTAGSTGAALVGNAYNGIGDAVENVGNKLSDKATAGRIRAKENERYEDLVHDDYIKGKGKEYKEVLKANFDKEKVKNMYKDGTINNYIENGVDNVQDIITAEKMREQDSTMSQKKAILIAKYADRVGNEYNGSKAKAWRDTFSDEYQHTAGKNKTESDKAARETMDYIKEFNKIKKTNHK